MAVDPLQLAIGALLGIIGTASVRWWQYQRDLWLEEVGQFCTTLDDAALCAVEYWLRERFDAVNDDEDNKKGADSAEVRSDLREIEIYEARLIGFQIKLDGLAASIHDRLSFKDGKMLNKNMEGISDSLTGGSYGSLVREIDADRARLAQVYASDTTVELRRALARALSMSGLLVYLWENLQKLHIKNRT